MNRIRELREAKGLSQHDLGRLLDVLGDTVGHWERGDTVPRQRNARRLAKRLGVSVEELNLDRSSRDA
jgi:transcriptional regulator with XRE-family HTH domain